MEHCLDKMKWKCIHISLFLWTWNVTHCSNHDLSLPPLACLWTSIQVHCVIIPTATEALQCSPLQTSTNTPPHLSVCDIYNIYIYFADVQKQTNVDGSVMHECERLRGVRIIYACAGNEIQVIHVLLWLSLCLSLSCFQIIEKVRGQATHDFHHKPMEVQISFACAIIFFMCKVMGFLSCLPQLNMISDNLSKTRVGCTTTIRLTRLHQNWAKLCLQIM